MDKKGWLAIAKLKPHSLFISLLSMLQKAFYIIKCVSLFTFYRFQAIKCARRQPSTFYGIEIGKK